MRVTIFNLMVKDYLNNNFKSNVSRLKYWQQGCAKHSIQYLSYKKCIFDFEVGQIHFLTIYLGFF